MMTDQSRKTVMLIARSVEYNYVPVKRYRLNWMYSMRNELGVFFFYRLELVCVVLLINLVQIRPTIGKDAFPLPASFDIPETTAGEFA